MANPTGWIIRSVRVMNAAGHKILQIGQYSVAQPGACRLERPGPGVRHRLMRALSHNHLNGASTNVGATAPRGSQGLCAESVRLRRLAISVISKGLNHDA